MQKFTNFRAACIAGLPRRSAAQEGGNEGGPRVASAQTRRDSGDPPPDFARSFDVFILERQTDFPSRLIKSHPPSLLAVSQLDNMKTEACANRFTDLSDVHFDDRRKKIWRGMRNSEKNPRSPPRVFVAPIASRQLIEL